MKLHYIAGSCAENTYQNSKYIPEPLGPQRATTFPAPISKDNSFRTCWCGLVGYVNETESNTTWPFMFPVGMTLLCFTSTKGVTFMYSNIRAPELKPLTTCPNRTDKVPRDL